MNLKSLSDSVLVSELKSKVLEERKLLNEILDLLSEVSSRKLYLDLAYPSLFEFCVKELGYSASSAFRRIEAMRLLKSLPVENQKEIKSKISEGTLNLTHLSQAQSFFKTEAKENNKTYSLKEKTQILAKIENKSKLETEKELIKISPQAVPPRQEVVRQLTEDKMSITLTIDSELMSKLQKLKHLKSHVNPNMSTAELINLLAENEIKRLEPKAQTTAKSNKTRAFPPAEVKESGNAAAATGQPSTVSDDGRPMTVDRSRYIPGNVKRQVWQRDQGRCTYVNKTTGEVCESRHLLQYDHIHEFTKGGSSINPNNIRLLCGAHNRHRNQKVFEF